MEESENSSGSETDLSDSWTLVNDDGLGRRHTDPDRQETSDSESLEVLDVELADIEETWIHKDHISADEDNHDKTCFTNDTDYSNITDLSVLDITTIRKVRMYVHHRNLYINMWLSVVMVITVAIALGLGIGHYLGMKRFVKAKDIIHHLKHENQVLEEELADVITKHKYCERSLEESVRHLMGRTKWCKFSDNFYNRNHYLQGNIYDNLMDEFDENGSFVERSSVNRRSFKEFVSNHILPMFSHGFNHFNVVYTENSDKIVGYVHPSKHTYFNSKYIEDDASVVGSCSSSPKVDNNANKTLNNTHFSTLKSDLIFLHFSLSKWNRFINEYMKVHAAIYEDNHLGQHSQNLVEVANDIAHMNVPQTNGHSNEVSHKRNKKQVLTSSNSYCGLKIEQCSLQKDQHEHKIAKCKASSSTEIFYALLKVYIHKPKSHVIGLNQTVHGTNFRNSQIRKHLVKTRENWVNKLISYDLMVKMSKQKAITLPRLHTEERKLTSHDRKKENQRPKSTTCTENYKEKDCKNSDYFNDSPDREHSFPNGIRRNKKDKGIKFNTFMNDKEKKKHFKHKESLKKTKKKEEERKHYYSKKPFQKKSFKLFQYFKNKHSKQFKKEHKQNKIYDKKLIFNNKDKMWNDVHEKREHIDKSKCMKDKCKNLAESYKKHYSKKDSSTYSIHEKKRAGDHGFNIYFKSRYILDYTHKSKKNDDSRKNVHENKTYLHNLSRVHKGEKLSREHWKERNKIYRINMQRMNIFKL